jgi:hypothetical protein
MRGKYKIAFLYGQSTYKIATEEKERIEKKYSVYPVEIRLMDDEYFMATSEGPQIINVLRQAFHGVDFALVFVGQDNYSHFFKSDEFSTTDLTELFTNKLMLEKESITQADLKSQISSVMDFGMSPNIVFEVGYLWTVLPPEKIRFVTICKDFSKIKFPSDLPNPFFYSYNTFGQFFGNIVEKILKAPKCNSLLKNNNYQCDYNSLFTKEELQGFDSLRKTAQAHFEAIDKLWKEQALELNTDEARIIFMFERLIFIPYFPQDSSCDKWIDELMYRISNKKTLCYEILKEIKTYFSLHREPKVDTNNIQKAKEYESIFDKLSKYKEQIKSTKKINNLIVLFWLNNYIALSARQYYLNDSQNVKYLNDSIDSLELCVQMATELNPNTADLWLGFTYFNLSRCYNLKKEEDKANQNMVKAYMTRKKWLTQNLLEKLPMIIESSFIAEVVFSAKEIISIEPNKKEEALNIKEFCIQQSYMLTTPGFENIRIIKDAIRILTEWKNETYNKNRKLKVKKITL